MKKIKEVFTKITEDVKNKHDKKYIHADLKPLNIVRMHDNWMLIDMDACCRTGIDSTGFKSSTSIVPPEAILLEPETGEIFVRSDKKGPALLSHESFDVWSLGCILYQMVNIEVRPLFQGDRDDNLSISQSDADSLWKLLMWDDELKQQKLAKIVDDRARNLLHRMLEKDFKKRIRIDQVLCHPFVTDKKMNKSQEYAIFISYRVETDFKHAEVLYSLLTERGLKVWWDNVELNKGENLGKNWKNSFCSGIVKSRAFICLISKNAISKWSSITTDSKTDNVLLEHRLACELYDFGYMKRIFPVFIGDYNPTKSFYENFFDCGGKPSVPSSVVVRSIEDELVQIMNLESLGTPLKPNRPVKDFFDEICSSQGHFIKGDSMTTAFTNCANTVVEMIKKIETEIQ
jgi:hypothetical protein